MKAIRIHQFGGPEQLRLEEVEERKPGVNEILIEVKAAGVNPVDTYIRSGTHSMKPALPYTPGFDAAGIVLEVGGSIPDYQAGDRVYTVRSVTGTYADKSICESKYVRHLPDNVDFFAGAALGIPYPTAYRALFALGGAQPGESVLIHGASGGVGIAAVQFARAHGMKVIGTASTKEGRDLILGNGAHHALDHSINGVIEKVLELTNGKGVNVIVEMLANKNLQADLSMLATRGRIIVVGNRGNIEVNMREAMMRDAVIKAMTIFNATDDERNAIHSALFAALESGIARPIVGKKLPLSEASSAHQLVMQPGGSGKIVLIP